MTWLKSKPTKIIAIIFAIFLVLAGIEILSGNNKSTFQQPSGQSSNNENAANQKPVTQISPPEQEAIEEIIDQTTGVASNKFYPVIKVIDGDTLSVDIDGQIEVLRLIGIDTPETVDPRKPVQCFGKEASNKAKELLSGKKVRLKADPTQGELDKYDRLLRYVFLEDGAFFNKLMISEGFAHEYTYIIPYNYQTEFQQAEKEARDNKRGLWADNTCAGETTTQITPKEPIESLSPPLSELSVLPAADCDCSGNNYNCTDFKTHIEAQAVYECCIQKAGTDIHRLDSDKDGEACEGLP